MYLNRFICCLIFLMVLISCHEQKSNSEINSPESYWKEQIALHPDSLLLKETLIQCYRDSGYYDKAINYADSLINQDSLDAKIWHIKGTLEFENEDTTAAEISFRKAFQLNPNPIDAIYMARILAYSGNPSATNICSEIIGRFGKDYEKDTYLITGIYFESTGENKKAMLYFDSSMHSSYTYMEAYLQKGLLQMKLGNYKDAIATFVKATTVQNNYDEGFFYLGKCYETIKDTAAAINAYNRTLLIDPNFIEAEEAIKRLSK